MRSLIKFILPIYKIFLYYYDKIKTIDYGMNSFLYLYYIKECEFVDMALEWHNKVQWI